MAGEAVNLSVEVVRPSAAEVQCSPVEVVGLVKEVKPVASGPLGQQEPREQQEVQEPLCLEETA